MCTLWTCVCCRCLLLSECRFKRKIFRWFFLFLFVRCEYFGFYTIIELDKTYWPMFAFHSFIVFLIRWFVQQIFIYAYRIPTCHILCYYYHINVVYITSYTIMRWFSFRTLHISRFISSFCFVLFLVILYLRVPYTHTHFDQQLRWQQTTNHKLLTKSHPYKRYVYEIDKIVFKYLLARSHRKFIAQNFKMCLRCLKRKRISSLHSILMIVCIVAFFGYHLISCPEPNFSFNSKFIVCQC